MDVYATRGVADGHQAVFNFVFSNFTRPPRVRQTRSLRPGSYLREGFPLASGTRELLYAALCGAGRERRAPRAPRVALLGRGP